MTLLVADFAKALRAAASVGASRQASDRARAREIKQRMGLLEQLVEAYAHRKPASATPAGEAEP